MEDEPRPSPSQLSQRLSYMDAGWLHVHTQEQIRLAKERVNDDIERELQVCRILSCLRFHAQNSPYD